jgi:hypothetical protein
MVDTNEDTTATDETDPPPKGPAEVAALRRRPHFSEPEVRILTLVLTHARTLRDLQKALGDWFRPGEVEDTAEALVDQGLLDTENVSGAPWRIRYTKNDLGCRMLFEHTRAEAAARPLRRAV